MSPQRGLALRALGKAIGPVTLAAVAITIVTGSWLHWLTMGAALIGTAYYLATH